MRVSTAARRVAMVPAATAVVVALTGCNLHISTNAEARDQWQRRYPLAQGGTLEIRNTNGRIHVEPVEGGEVDIRAERVIQAATDEAAKEALAAFTIDESVAPDRVVIDSANRGALHLNMNRRVDYEVRVPMWANVRFEATNGTIVLAGPRLTGRFRAETTNGRIEAAGLENGAMASTTNGSISLRLAKLGSDGVSCETTNGKIEVAVPPDANARLSARVTNGAIRTEGLNLAVSEQSRRRLDATLGAGGPAITLTTTNGAIDVSAAR